MNLKRKKIKNKKIEKRKNRSKVKKEIRKGKEDECRNIIWK